MAKLLTSSSFGGITGVFSIQPVGKRMYSLFLKDQHVDELN